MRRSFQCLALAGTALALLAGCDDRPGDNGVMLNERVIDGDGGAEFTADIWVDNWFSMSVNGEPLMEDSVAYQTERSFNAERVTFSADLPMTVAFEFRDFKENDTGLEYIGTGRQQVGDGGAIVQLTDAETGEVLKVSNSSWKCLVIHRAPVDEACASESDPTVGEGACAADVDDAPAGWSDPGFDDAQWPAATEHSESDVSPKDGYDEVDWATEARLIWSDDLKLDNTILCRTTIDGG